MSCSVEARAVPTELPQRAALREHYLSRMATACACPDDACFDREIVDALTGLRECRVWTHTFKATLQRVAGQRKWTGIETSGLCRDTNATVIESDASAIKWKFTQTRLATDITIEFCKDRTINEPSIYSFDASGAALLKCDVIDFGP